MSINGTFNRPLWDTASRLLRKKLSSAFAQKWLPFTKTRAISHTSNVPFLEMDLYKDLHPPTTESPANIVLQNERLGNLKPGMDVLRNFPEPLVPASSVDRSLISKSFFLVKKEKGELLEKLVLDLSQSLKSKEFYVASSGDLDVLGSGIVLLCCGKSLEYIEHFDQLPHAYTGLIRIGQVSNSYDLKTPVLASYSWKQISDENIEKLRNCFVGDVFLPPAPFVPVFCKNRDGIYTLKPVDDLSSKPCTIYSFNIHRVCTNSPELIFSLVCDSCLSPAVLADQFGQRLGCGAILYDLHKSSIGEYKESMAWNADHIISVFSKAKEGNIHYPNDYANVRLSSKSMRYLERATGQNWFLVLRGRKKHVKLKPYEIRHNRAVRRDLEARGLISDEDIMQRKLKKKAVKLVANMNVEEVERVYERILEE